MSDTNSINTNLDKLVKLDDLEPSKPLELSIKPENEQSEPNESSELTKLTEIAEPSKPSEPANLAESTKPSEPSESTDISNDKLIDTICMSGGGVKGFSFIGALDYLQEKSIIDLNQISNWVGTSAGAIMAYLFSLGFNTQEIGDFILDFNFEKIDPEVNIDNLLLNHGIDTGAKIMYVLTNFLKIKYELDDITFSQHYKLTNKKLVVIGTNFSKGTEAIFSHEKTPDMSVLTAVRISISIPVVFTPVLYEGEYYVDGALINNFPINKCNPATTIGIYIRNSANNEMTDILSLISGCFAIIGDTISLKDCDGPNKNPDKFNIISIENYKNEFTNFNLDRDKKLKIINLGQIFAKKYVDNLSNLTN